MEKQKSMNANENQNPTAITNTIIDPQFKMLMTIRHFDRDLDKYKKKGGRGYRQYDFNL